MTNLRGIHLVYGKNKSFVSCLSIPLLISGLSKAFGLTPDKKDRLTEELYCLTANYDINKQICWMSVSRQNGHVGLRWGISPAFDSMGLSHEQISAIFYVWKTASCTPEEASKVLNVPLKTLMAISEQFI